MKKSLFFILLILLATVVLIPSVSNARFDYYDSFNTKYPRFGSIGCELCHATATPLRGNAPRNSYGSAWELYPHATVKQRNQAFKRLEPRDADGDGVTNLTEIVANTFSVHVLPGFARLNDTFPSFLGYRAVPQRLLFFDNFSNAVRTSVPNWTILPRGGFRGNRVRMVSSMGVTAFAYPMPSGGLQAQSSFRTGSISAIIRLLKGQKPSVSVIFSRTALGYRFVSVSRSDIEIGQEGTVGGIDSVPKKKISFAGFDQSAQHKLKVILARTGQVRVFVDNALVASRRFPGRVVAGNVGFRSKLTLAQFDNVVISR